MNKSLIRVLGPIVIAAGMLSCTVASAQQENVIEVASAQPKTLNDGVFTVEQAKAGEMVYDASCKTCHDMKFYENTLRSWNSQPLMYLWETIMGTMPADNPGSMMFEEYTDVLAYILSEAGFPAGEVPLDHNQGMDTISIVRP